MARSTVNARSQPPATGLPHLTVPRAYLGQQLEDRILRGRELLERPISSERDLEGAKGDYSTWTDYNHALLRRSFSTAEPADEYQGGPAAAFARFEAPPLHEKVEEFHRMVARRVQRLSSLKERLSLYEELPTLPHAARTRPTSGDAGTSIFIVHGHSEAQKLAVARFITQISAMEPVILHEQANNGRTIMEKFEDHAATAAFAVVLLTGDDEGGLVGSGERQHRARQNVVFELGFFIGALGRSRVAVLYEADVELPSDMSGVLYTPLDSGEAWKLALGKEMRAAGLEIDLNRAL